jgi:nicotinamidase-related amidase
MPNEPTCLDPAQCALLVMDYQPVVLGSMSDSDALVSRTNQAIDIVRRHGGVVGFVRIAFDHADYGAVPSTNKAFSAVAAAKHLQNNMPGTAIHADLAPQPGDLVVRKTRVGAFTTTGLDELLTNLGVTTLILAGVHTSGVVLSTVRDAADKDYQLIVLSDCTSDPDREVHDWLMQRVFPRQAKIATVAELGIWLSET